MINLAVALRQKVKEECILEKKTRDENRRRKMMQEHQKRKIIERKNDEAKGKLSELHLIATTDELDEVLEGIDDNKEMSESKKELEKLSIIKLQVNIRRKVLGQKIKIQYTVSRKKRPVSAIIADFRDSMTGFPLPDYICNPCLLVGKKIHHNFQVNDDGKTNWYYGTICSYNPNSKTH